MTSLNAAILSKKLVGDDKADPAVKVIGTGPFRTVKWDPDKTLTLEANKDFYIAGQPRLAGIEMRTIPDEASILAALRAGTVDWALINDPRTGHCGEFFQQQLHCFARARFGISRLAVERRARYVQRSKVRQAVSCAINRQEVLDTASLGEGEVTNPLTPPFYRADLSKLDCYKKDAEKSKTLLKDAGSPKVTFKAIVANAEPPTAIAEAQNIQAQLKPFGIDMQIESLELSVYVARWLAADFDAAIALNGGNPDPHNMFVRYWTQHRQPQQGRRLQRPRH